MKFNQNEKMGNVVKEMEGFVGKNVVVEYDGKEFTGTVKNVYVPSNEELDQGVNPGLVVHDKSNAYKHIKSDRIESVKVV